MIDELIKLVIDGFKSIKDHRKYNSTIAVELIVCQDGNVKNDCEINAAKRLIPQIRQAMPQKSSC